MLPPIWQLPRPPRSSGKNRSAASAAFCTASMVTPASTVMVPAAVSSSRMVRMRSRQRMTQGPTGTAPPASPVSPPCGCTAMPRSLQKASTFETCSVLRGNTSACTVRPGAPVTQKSRVCFSRSDVVGARATSAPTRACSSARTVLSVISPAQPAVILGDIVAVLARVVDDFRGPGGIGAIDGLLLAQRGQFDLVHQRGHALVFRVHRIAVAAAQAALQVLQLHDLGLVERTGRTQLLAQAREPIGRDHALLAQHRADGRRVDAGATADEAAVAGEAVVAVATLAPEVTSATVTGGL